MGVVATYEQNSTPKLTLSKLPCKPRVVAMQMLTPPLHPSLSIPFHWEEAPGKPRVDLQPNKVARCLDLPPRLFNEMTSPTTSLSLACTSSSFRESKEKFGSKRWGSFREEDKFDDDDFTRTRVRRKRSFFFFSINSGNLLADMYASFKQAAVPWKRNK